MVTYYVINADLEVYSRCDEAGISRLLLSDYLGPGVDCGVSS